MGFGHRVYRAEDPRARVLRRTAREIGSPRLEAAEALEQAALAELQARRPDRVLATNVEFWSAVVLDIADVPPDLFTPMFTCARVGGLGRAHPRAEARGPADPADRGVRRPAAEARVRGHLSGGGTGHLRVAVVGHVEWTEFVAVDRMPAAGAIVEPEIRWEEPAGGGAVAAVQLGKLAGSVLLLTALGDDEAGHRAAEGLRELGVEVVPAWRPARQPRALTFVDAGGERTIIVLGGKLAPAGSDALPWERLAQADAVYFVSGDAGALRAARRATTLVATARELPTLASAGVELDVLVRSGEDAGEAYRDGDVEPAPRTVVTTLGADGGRYSGANGGAYRAAPLPGPVADAYGCGDSFAAGLTYGLGGRRAIDEAVALGARCGAACLTGRGPYAGQLRSAV